MNEKEYIDRRMEAYAAEQKEWLADQVAGIPTTPDRISIVVEPLEVNEANVDGMDRLADALDEWRDALLPGQYVVRITAREPER